MAVLFLSVLRCDDRQELVDGSRLVLYGQSLGGAVAVAALARVEERL
eukprot:SAG11_NODE_5628_length_1503_cov_2.356125_2_plen_47_part_00